MMHLDRVSRLARWLHFGTLIYMVFLPVAIVVSLFMTPVNLETAQAKIASIAISQNATQAQLWTAMVLQSLPALVLLWTFNEMRKLFLNFRNKDILSDPSALLIQRIGVGLLALAGAHFLLVPVQSVLLSWENPVGERALSIGLTSDMIGFVLAAGLLIVIGWAMRDASQVAAENRAFI